MKKNQMNSPNVAMVICYDSGFNIRFQARKLTRIIVLNSGKDGVVTIPLPPKKDIFYYELITTAR